MRIIKEFQDFAMKWNVIDLAVWVVIWWAFWKIVSSLVEYIITPFVWILMKWADFADLSFGIWEAQIKYGMFLQAVIDFTIVAFVLFLVVKTINTAKKKISRKEKAIAKKEAVLTPDQELLKEIRDILRNRK